MLRKERMMTVAMAGLLFGMIIRKNTPGHEHPSTMAAFSRSRGMERKNWRKRKMLVALPDNALRRISAQWELSSFSLTMMAKFGISVT